MCGVFVYCLRASLGLYGSGETCQEKKFLGKGGMPWIFRFPFFEKINPFWNKGCRRKCYKTQNRSCNPFTHAYCFPVATNGGHNYKPKTKMKFQLIMIGTLTGNMISFGTFPSLEEAMRHAKELPCELYESPLIREVICAY